jgi:hypothetical protein
MGGAVGRCLPAAQGIHLCSTFPSPGYACDFGDFVRLLDDTTVGIEIVDALMRLPSGIRAGIRLPGLDGKASDWI